MVRIASRATLLYNRTIKDGEEWAVQWEEQPGDYPIVLRIVDYTEDGELRETIVRLTHERARMLRLVCDDAIKAIEPREPSLLDNEDL